MKKNLLFVVLFTSFLTITAQQQDQWTPENIINTEYIQSPVFSEDGNMVVWTKSEGNTEKDKFVQNLYLTRLNLLKDNLPLTVALTKNEDNDSNPVFSENGETIYFLSSRDEGKKLWSISIYGGEAQEVHEFKNGISNLKRLDKNNLIFVSKEGKSLYEQETEKDNTIVIEDEEHWKVDRVYSFNISEKTTRRLTENDFPVFVYSISHDGKYLVTGHMMSRSYGADARIKPKFFLHDLEKEEYLEILEGIQQPSSFAFEHGSQGFYFTSEVSTDPEWNGAGILELHYFDVTSREISKVDLAWENGLGNGFDLVKDGVVASLANGATNVLSFYKKEDTGWKKYGLELGVMKDHVSVLAVSPTANQILFDHSTAQQLPEYYFATPSYRKGFSLESQKVFIRLNEALKKKKIAKREVIEWDGANGDKISGILYYPKNYESGKKYPLVLSIHGGPSSVDLDKWSERWSTYPQILTQKDAFVLKPNYHGSSNHGLAFVESIKNNYYDLEMTDIINGIEYLNERGLIDMDRLGTMGWSNGAILTTMLTVRYPEMFKVAAPGAGDVNWTSDFGTCQFGVSFDQSYFGGAPWDDVDGETFNPVYIEKSPLFELDKVKTPTIIFHGSEDRAVPRDQGWEYYRALQQIAAAPVKFLWFPGQPHGLQKITHQLRKMNEEIAWFDKYLFNTYKEKNESFKKDSPLAYRLMKDSLSVHQNAYGTEVKGTIVPEMVSLGKDSVSISVFEITNAQYGAFDPAFSFLAGKGDFPVTGLNKEQITGYITWLGSLSNKSFRLPGKNEALALHKAARKAYSDQNNLNYWAGYDITWDEIADFKLKFTEAEGEFIEAVDHRKPVKISEVWLYGVGGNVAEYYNTGTDLLIYDYSAYDYVDPADETLPEQSNIIGFRVVCEEL